MQSRTSTALVLLLTCLTLPLCWAEKPYLGTGLRPSYLRCEYRIDPLGIDETAPRLSWFVESGERAEAQTAYRLLVASSEQLLSKDNGDLWDSGKVESDDTTGSEYTGQPLVSHERCFWKVKVWDQDGRESPWSAPAQWSMGLLAAQDWRAQWIGYDKARARELLDAQFGDAKWIWHAADEPTNAPKCQRLFAATFQAPKGVNIKQATLLATADDAMKFAVNGHQVLITHPGKDTWREVQQANVTAQVQSGENQLRVVVENAKPGPAGLLARLVVTTEDGRQSVWVTDGSWKSSSTVADDWFKGGRGTNDWPAARVVGDYGAAPWGKLKVAELFLPPAPYLRTRFGVEKPVARATLYGAALGLVELHLNGRMVSDDYFTPGWTDYAKRVHYRAYDVTSFVRQGDNTLGAVLADGWFSGFIGFHGDRDLYGKNPRFRAQLHLEYTDGSSADVGTGPDWKASTGPILEADFLKGETYDARRERPGWDEPGCDDSGWDGVVTGSDEVKPRMEAHPGPPVRAIHEFKPKKITEPQTGVYVFDLGQNFAGVARLKVSGKPGQHVVLRFAERLAPDGNIYTANLRGARSMDTYICKGRGTEVWQPRFTFHGFQYVEVTGLNRRPAMDTITGVALSSDAPEAGSFVCSDPMLNQLHSNIYWTQRANFIDIPTDCPQRDERLGWMGDAQVYCRAATLNADVEAFFTKWMVDVDDAQRADGEFTQVAPSVVAGPDGGPAWADAGVICPWTIYAVYGDRRILARSYDSMVRFIEFCRKRSTSDLLPPEKYHCFGDWLSIKADTPKDVIYTAYFAWSTHLLAQAAAVLGKTEDAKKYNELFEKIRHAFNHAYVDKDGRIKGDTQTCYVLALAFDLVEGPAAKQAANHLVENIQSRGWHLSTGFIGTKELMLVLSKIGRSDVACRLIHNDTFPSWGFSIKQGATSIWERWDGWTPEKGFQDAGMNSFAHYSFGAVYQWMVENIGGIRSEAPTYKKIRIAPQMDPKLTKAEVSYQSVRGLIATAWEQHRDRLSVHVTIPANTMAEVELPAASTNGIRESGHRLDRADGVKFLRMEGPKAVIAVGSGNYDFVVRSAESSYPAKLKEQAMAPTP
jgi:alpha-L-rhamnosidase